jgi:chromosome segregation ATPase
MYFTSKSVLNTDLFDQRRYDEILQMSKKMQEIDKLGRQILPSFSPLMGDIWASLFKSSPEVLEETSDELMVNKNIMKRVMKDGQFETYRETTKLDDLASAIGTLTFSEKTYQWLEQQERKNLEYAEKIGQYRELMKQATEKKEKAKKQQEKAQLAKEKSNVNAEKLQQQADQLEQKAELAFQQAAETGESIAQMLEQMMQGQKFQAMY